MIKYKKYLIEQEQTWFNLHESKKAKNKTTGKFYDTTTTHGHGYNFPGLIEKIKLLEVGKKVEKGEIETLKQWVDEYKVLHDEIKDILSK